MRRRISRFIKRYAIHWAASTVILYLILIGLAIWVFPATTLILTVAVLFVGFTASMASLADLLPDDDEEV